MQALAKTNQIDLCTDTDLLLEELRSCSLDLLRNVGRMAAIVRRLDELGVEVAIENSLLPYIRLIAHGQLAAESFVSLSGDAKLLERVIRLPLPLQEQIAQNEPLRVMDMGGDHRMVRPLDMSERERKQVFFGKRLRTDAEQIGWLREQFDKDRTRLSAKQSTPEIAIDRRRRGVVVNDTFIPIAQLAEWISALSR
jgi:hypothetical protein